jgi:DNA-binding transcriptional MerR regulator
VLANAAVRNKSPEAFRTISEVAVELDVPQHVLRFWEGRFAQIKPVKRAGGRRYYRPEDVDLLRGIRALLYREGFTIKGVQKILKERGHRHVIELGRGEAAPILPTPRPMPVRTVPGEIEDALPSNVIPLDRLAEPVIVDRPMGHEEPAATGLAEEERVRLEILLAELLQMKARLRSRRDAAVTMVP